ncbi:MAG: glycosyltransferase [Mariprofundales bacterium]|nr:glycosyltransferase [Mariprofundales bacterium]
MISIITAVHNQIEFNRLFLYYLERNTHHPYELIIVDNHSTDGSAELFEQHGAIVIRNAENHCYPDSQNMGMARATHDYFAFLNNDIVLAQDWDRHAIAAMRIHGLDVASLGSWESVEDPYQRRAFNQRWKWLRKGKRYLQRDMASLEKLMNSLYGSSGSFKNWSAEQYAQFYPRVHMGICGSAVITTRQAWQKLGGLWDVQMEAADFDLHLRTTQRAVEVGDIRPPFIIPWALHHHFSRVTFRGTPEPRSCDHQHRSVDAKWDAESQQQYGPKNLQEQGFYVKLRRFVKRFRVSKVVNREQVPTKS